MHLEHGCCDPGDFNKYLKFAILEVVSPSNIEVKEFKWMHRLNCFQPKGINVEYPFGLPYNEGTYVFIDFLIKFIKLFIFDKIVNF